MCIFGFIDEVKFTAYDDELERVEVFKYLGRLLAMDDVDMQAVRANLKKARKSWRMLSRLLRSEKFYKAVVQAVLLYGSESWALTESQLRCLHGFHIRAAYRMTKVNKPKKMPGPAGWWYPSWRMF